MNETPDEVNTVEVIFDDKVIPSFTVRMITSNEGEEAESKEDTTFHCVEQSFIGSSEVQEWSVDLDDSFSESLPTQGKCI